MQTEDFRTKTKTGITSLILPSELGGEFIHMFLGYLINYNISKCQQVMNKWGNVGEKERLRALLALSYLTLLWCSLCSIYM